MRSNARHTILVSLILPVTILLTVTIISDCLARGAQSKVSIFPESWSTPGSARDIFGLSQVPLDTFYYGGTVIGPGGVPYADESSTPGWANRKMWTWSPGGFNGTAHSGLNMDGWIGVDVKTDTSDFFKVRDNASLGAVCVISGNRSLVCGATNTECAELCYADLDGAGYGNYWNQVVATESYTYEVGHTVNLSYQYLNQSEGGYDSTYVKLEVYDAVEERWVEQTVLACYSGTASSIENIDVDSYLSTLGKNAVFRFVFQFVSDRTFSDEDGFYSSTCGGFVLDNYALTGDVTDSEGFEAVPVGELPAGWSKLTVVGCGDLASAEQLDNLPMPITADPCVTVAPQLCNVADSVLVLFDPDNMPYPHPLCQDNYVVSPIIDFSGHANLSGRFLHRERFASLPLTDQIFMYWLVRYKPGCASGGWGPWLSDNYFYYTREGTNCSTWQDDVSSYIPPDAQQVQVALGVVNFCDEDPWAVGCSYTCNATPYYDNVTFGVFGSDIAPHISMRELDYWQDQFAEDGTLNPISTADTRVPGYLGLLDPPIFGDTLVCRGTANNMEVYFVFRMARVGPQQTTTLPFFTTWFPSAATGGWCQARMDTAELTTASYTLPSPGSWMCAFHEDDPVAIINALPEGTEILPNNIFVPGTRIEYFLKSRYAGSSNYFFLPDTAGGRIEEFEVLPTMANFQGSVIWPCIIVADHFGQRGNWGERNSDRIARQLSRGGYVFDVFNRLAPASDQKNGIARWTPNPGQIGAPGDDEYNWGPGATLMQMAGYSDCLLNTGDVYGYCVYKAEADMFTTWLTGYSDATRRRFLWVSGDQIVREMNRRSWGKTFLNNVLCASYPGDLSGWSYAHVTGDFTYCLPMNGISGGRIACPDPEQFVVRSNGCPRKLSITGVSTVSACGARAEIEYNAAGPAGQQTAAVSNAPGGKYYTTFVESYDNCLIRTDALEGLFACGGDDFIVDWYGCVLDWAGHNPSTICPIYEPPPLQPVVEWRNLIGGSKVLVCPASSPVPPDDSCATSWIYVKMSDVFGIPVPGLTITAVFDATCDMTLCSPVSAVTDSNGEAALVIRAGLDVEGNTDCCEVLTSVRCMGVTLYEARYDWLSTDMNADSTVTTDDIQILNSDWLTSACRSDFNGDGTVDPVDYGILEAHFTHSCASSLIGIPQESGPIVTRLSQNYPNPFNPLTGIKYSVTAAGKVQLRVYDIAGRPVRTLVDWWKEPGYHQVGWDGRDDGGNVVSSGVYFYRLDVSGHSETRKMVLLK